MVKNPPTNAEDIRDEVLIPGLGRFPGGGHDNPLSYSCLENPTDRGAWKSIPFPVDLPKPGIEPGSPALQMAFY